MTPTTDIRASVKLSLPLPFQQDLFGEIRKEDCLVILARGLGLPRIVSSLLHSYDAAGDSLILVVGADERENGWIGESLVEYAAISKSLKARGLSIINTDVVSVGARQKLYTKGGIFSITSRILVVDLLTNLVNPESITGIVVLHADRVIATSLEAFILRIYRQKNKTGFLKAFTDNPEPFTTGFAPLATMMRNLFQRKTSLWPRFHVTVASSLEGKKPEVVELEVAMTDSMRDIQTALLECIEVSVSELRKANSQYLDLEDWTVDSALHKSFDLIIRRQLDPVWHRISFRTRQVVNDLTMLRGLLQALLSYDCVTFHRHLETILAINTPLPGSVRQNQSPWLYLDAAQTAFSLAKRRVYTGDIKSNTLDANSGDIPIGIVPRLEEQPKWAVLAEVLEECERELYFNPTPRGTSNGTTLIMCSDEATCRQIREYLQIMHERLPEEEGSDEYDDEKTTPSAEIMMRRKLRQYLAWKRDFLKVSRSLFKDTHDAGRIDGQKRGVDTYRGKAPPNKRRRVRGGSSSAAASPRGSSRVEQIEDQYATVAELLSEVQPTDVEQNIKHEVAADPLENMEDYFELYEMSDLVVVHPYDGDMDDHVLEELRPRFVVMYDPDAAFIRRIEVYRSSHEERNIKAYFMYYGESTEERRYLSSVRKEKDAFTKLIREKSSMAITLTADGKGVEDPQEQFLRIVNTRIAGGGRLTATSEPPRVVVDIREFRSSLPSLLHGRNITIVPCMLTVGDYVLSPDICIERKSVKDLISSFKDGRLYNQCETMFQYYKHPMLLIEFDHNKSFNLEPFADLSSNIGQEDLQSKIVILTIAFPQLKIIWSSSPYQTAEIFEELKKNNSEPDPVKAVMTGLGEGEDPMSAYNQTPQDLLRAIPGITIRNYKSVMLEVGNILELSNMEEAEICALIGTEAGRQAYRFMNRSIFDV